MRSDKIRDMVRSILPSKARRRARKDKAILKRTMRHAVRIDLRKENIETTKADLRRQPNLSWIVWERRGADKLNHFMRWCEARTKGMSTADALSHVRALVPSSLIGEHAYGHWEAHRNPRYFSTWRPYDPQSFHDSTLRRLRRALAIAPDLHRAINARIKSRKPSGEPRRLLLGLHDVEAFVRDINPLTHRHAPPDDYDIERSATLELIEQIEKGGRRAALRVMARQSHTSLQISHCERPHLSSRPKGGMTSDAFTNEQRV